MRTNRNAFTLIELAIAVFILLIILMLGVPSLNGVLADRRLRRSYEGLNNLVRQAQERAIADRRTYLIRWDKKQITLEPEALIKGESKEPVATLPLQKGDAFILQLPAALLPEPPAEWAFWPSGTCEPARVQFKGVDGSWTATYSPLTARGELTNYVAQ